MSYFNIKEEEIVFTDRKLQSLRKALPTISIGSNDANRLNINLKYKDDTKDIDTVNFTTETRSQVTNAGQMNFNIDSVEILQLNDTNQYVTGSLNITSSLNIGGSLSVGNKSVLNNVNVLGNLNVDGSTNLKNNLRLSGNYINFGTTSGDSGIGLKNNSGTIQYKNTGGSWSNFGSGGSGSITNVTSDGNMIEFNNHVNITGKLNIGGTLSVGGDLNVSGNTTYSLKNGTRHLFGMNTKGLNAVQQQKLTASDGASNDQFGFSVSLFKDYALISAWKDDSNKGSAYIFKRNGSTWIQQQKLIASDGASGDYFGTTVSLYGDYALIGVRADDSNKGSAYIFKRNGNIWNQQQKLTASDGSSGDYFGWSVSINEDYILIGSPYHNSGSGTAYIFKRNDSTWTQQDKLTASDVGSSNSFGRCVNLFKDYALIGEPYANSLKGAVYIFKKNGSIWSQQQKLTASDGANDDYFGGSASLYDDYALIGAYSTNDSGTASGSAYIFKRNGSTWTQQQKLIASDSVDNHHFGNSVSLYGDYALIGTLEATDRGSAYIFKRNGSTFTQQAKFTASDGADDDEFGWAVSLYGSDALIGAREDDSHRGSAYIFNITEDTLLLENKPNDGTTIASFVSGSKMGIGTNNPDYKLHIEDYEPQIALKSTNDSHQEASCRSEILFKDHDNYCLSKIVGQHEGSGNDSKGALLFYTNPNLSYSLGLGMKIDNDQVAHMYGNVNISGSVNIKYSLKIEKSLSVGEKSYLSNVNIQGNLSVLGSVNIGGSLNIGNKVYISDGHISAEVKNFLIDHPTIEGKKLRHGCLEGPENGIYCLGTIVNSNNLTTIHLTDYFTALVGDKYTVNLTPHGPYYVYVKESNKNMVLVESDSNNYGFDYFIIGQRSPINIIE